MSENAYRDQNGTPTMIGLDDSGEIVNLRVSSDGLLNILQGGNTAFVTGQKNVASAGTAETLGSGAIHQVTIVAKINNSGNIYVGASGSSLSSNGLILTPGMGVQVLIDNLSKVYIDADNSGEGVSYLAY